jgi:endo-1,4-beta-xylanase
MKRRSFLSTAGGALATSTVFPSFASAKEDSPATLRILAGGHPRIGAAVPTRFNGVLGERGTRLLADHFDSVTSENCMKWPHLCPKGDEYHFNEADQLVAFAEKNRQNVIGHTLIFNREKCYPDWLFRDGQKEAAPKLVWKRIEDHVANLMGRYKGKIDSWDVLNEFVEPNDAGYRETDFTRVLGGDYPVRLFKLAAEIDPKAKLIYNDFGLEDPNRRKAILAFVRSLMDRGCRVDIVGSQCHIELDERIGGKIEATIRECAALGLRTAFTELDVDVIPRKLQSDPKTRDDPAALDPYANGAPDEILQKQAEVYRQVFQAVVSNRKHVDRVTFWGITDASSWLNKWPWKRVNHGLLFDRDAKPKPAFHAVAKVLAEAR